jgi:uncharacterized protein YecT (DUF1311 family)
MHRVLGLIVFLCVNSLPSPARSIDCAGANHAVDHLICEDPSLKKADADMSKAYFALLKETKDPVIHQALISSQQRWLRARYLEGSRWGHGEDDRHHQIVALQAIIRSRTERLSTRDGVAETSPLVANAVAEQRYASRFSGGPYSGYWTECDFIPTGNGDSDYECFGTNAIQNAARVCSVSTSWATGKYYEDDKVANVADNTLVTVAGCGEEDAQCPVGDYKPPAPEERLYGWNFHVTDSDDNYNPDLSRLPVMQVDPDFAVEGQAADASDWMTQCLTDPDFPPRSMESPATVQ